MSLPRGWIPRPGAWPRWRALRVVLVFVLEVSMLAASSLPSMTEEATSTLQAYLRLDTSNPPGRELVTARFLKAILDREGIEARIFELGEGRANLWAKISGDGSRGGLALLHHMDVVPANAQHWEHPPFSGELLQGEIHGRGAVDIKGKGIVDLMTLIRLKRAGVELSRDLVLLAVADEEVESIGTQRLLAEQPELLTGVEFLLDEGGAIRTDARGEAKAYLVSVAEKAPLWLELRFLGEPGHGSLPRTDSAVSRALAAAGRIMRRPKRLALRPEFEAQLASLVEGRDLSKLPGWRGSLEESLGERSFLWALAEDPELHAMMGNTISITRMQGSDKINTIPNRASLGLDCRLMPGVEPEDFLEELEDLIRDPEVRIEVLARYDGAVASPVESALMDAIRHAARRRHRGVPVIPSLLTSSTEAYYYRRAGILVYGFEAYPLDKEAWERAHGNDERLPVAALAEGIEVLTELVLHLNGLAR